MGTSIRAVDREMRVHNCDTCGKNRLGRAATGWPPGDDICPNCRRILQRAADLDIELHAVPT